MSPFQPGRIVHIEHVKPWKSTITTSGVVREWSDGLLTLQRTFKAGGRYDSLGERILPGDYGTIEVPEGGWVLRRAYFRADGRPIGELYNVQTPAELGRDRVRYTDLEVDVVRFPDGRVQVVDEEDLDTVVRSGALSPELAERARAIAYRLADTLRAGGDWRTADN
jgi:probable ribonuclease FAU-1